MAIDLTTVGVKLEARGMAQVKGAFAGVKKDMQGLLGPVNLVKSALGGLGAALVGGAILRKFASESIEAQKTTAQLAAVLKSTGGAAGVTMRELDEMASSMQGLSTFGDDAIKSAQALLLTFTQIRGPEFRGATQAVLDMSTAMGTDLKASAIQVGKALNDPIKGVSALAKAGIQFSESQKAMIKSLVETGQTAKAQQLILKELEVQFGGSALAARNTLGGALAHLENAWGDLFEVSAESSTGIVGAINAIADALPNARQKIDKAFSGLIKWIREVEERMEKVQNIAFAINRFFGGSAGNMEAGGGGGGRGSRPDDPPVVRHGSGAHLIAPPRGSGGAGGGGTGTGSGKAKVPAGPEIPKFNMPDIQMPSTMFDENPFDVGGFSQVGMTPDQLAAMLDKYRENREWLRDEQIRIEEDAARSLADASMRGAEFIGSTMDAAFAAAFRGEGLKGVFGSLAKSALSGLGTVFTQMGQKMVAGSALMQAFQKAMMSFAPAGGIVAGLGLMALGSAMGAMAASGGGAGRVPALTGRSYSDSGEGMTRLKFVNRPIDQVQVQRSITVNQTIIGVNDPKAQREIAEMVRKAERR